MRTANVSNNNFNSITKIANPPKSQESIEQGKASKAFDGIKTTKRTTEKVINGSMGMGGEATSKTQNLFASQKSIFGETNGHISLQNRVSA